MGTQDSVEPTSVEPPRVTKLLAALLVAVLAGQVQNIGLGLAPGLHLLTYIDDGVVALAALVAIPRLRSARGAPVLAITTWVVFLSFALVRAVVENGLTASDAFFLYRQVVVPAVVILIGLVLTYREWLAVGRLVVILGLINAVYIFVEIAFGRLVEPVAIQEGKYVGYFYGHNPITGDVIDRAGGLLLNPPTMGIFMACAMVIAWNTWRGSSRWMAVSLCGIALWLTGSRGGLLLGITGMIMPWAGRVVGVWVALLLLGLGSIPVAFNILSQAGSSSHAEGLLLGLSDAFQYPFGRGFGFAGNFRPDAVGSEGASESLFAIAFSAAGLPAVALALCLTVALVVAVGRRGRLDWVAAIGLGGVLTAFFAETASALNGTIPVWLAVGLALSDRTSFPDPRVHGDVLGE